MIGIGMRSIAIPSLTRRGFLAGSAACLAVRPAMATPSEASLRATVGRTTIAADVPEVETWMLAGQPGSPWRFPQNADLKVALANDLPVPVVLDWRGLDGAPSLMPLLSTPPLQPGQSATLTAPLRQAGSFYIDAWAIDDKGPRIIRSCPLVTQGPGETGVDRDEVLVIEDWPSGPPQPDTGATPPATRFTLNGKSPADISVSAMQRVRLRFINASYRSVVALKIDGHEVTVIGFDGAPAEPFPARAGQLILAAGSRADVIIDATKAAGSTWPILLHDGTTARVLARLVYDAAPVRAAALSDPPPPHPDNGLPPRLDLQRAVRADLALGDSLGVPPWSRAADFKIASPPAFKAKRDRTVLLTLTNPGPHITTFRLHGHHFRLLDKLDDGWKPFWLDTLAVEPSQTQRIAFAAGPAGGYILSAISIQPESERMVRWFAVE